MSAGHPPRRTVPPQRQLALIRPRAERHHAVNHRLQQSALEKLEHGIKLRLAPHERTQNRELPREEIADIDFSLEAGRRAAGDQPPPGLEAEHALLPRSLPDVLEDDIHAAATGESFHLARELSSMQQNFVSFDSDPAVAITRAPVAFAI